MPSDCLAYELTIRVLPASHRFAILYIPNIIGYILVLTVGSDISWVTAAYQSMLCALMIAVSIALIVLKEEMQESNPVLVKHALYTCGFSFLLAAVFISKTVCYHILHPHFSSTLSGKLFVDGSRRPLAIGMIDSVMSAAHVPFVLFIETYNIGR
jgi:hypothetical protein